MALKADLIWEVQTTGSDDNGGGFDDVSGSPGTDYTFGGGQTTIEWAAAGGDFTNDLAATDASPSVLSSVARNFIAADVGNLIHISAGTNFTAGWYQIISVAANNATLDRNASSGGAASAGSGILGGALASLGGLGKVLHAHGVAGMKAYLKSGTYNLSSAVVNVDGGALDLSTTMNNKAFDLKGYETTRADYAARPTIHCNGNAPTQVIYLSGVSSGIHYLDNVLIDGDSQAVNGIRGGSKTYNRTHLCEVSNCDNSYAYSALTVFRCKASSCAAEGFTSCLAHESWADACSYGFDGHEQTLVHCLASNNTFVGFYGNSAIYDNCVSYQNGGDGFFTPTAARGSVHINCISYLDGAYAFGGADRGLLVNCAHRNSVSGRTNATPVADIGAITLTADPFTNAAGGDFSLNDTAGGGALCRAAGVSPVGQTGYPDLGAVQHGDPGGLLVHPGTSGGARG